MEEIFIAYIPAYLDPSVVLLIVVLVSLMTLDILTGIFKAIKGVSDKSTNGGVRSSEGVRGITKKVTTLLLVIVAFLIDYLVGTSFIGKGVTFSYCMFEIASIVENAGILGVEIPDKLKQGLDLLKDKDKEK